MNEFVFAFLFFLPAGLANLSPVIGNKIPGWNKIDTPMDFGKSWGGHRVFGANKTWRGLISGVVIGALSGGLIGVFFGDSMATVNNDLSLMSLGSSNFMVYAVLGALLGAGALLGDAVESYFKRRAKVPSGDSWFPFDQMDYILGGIFLSSLLVQLTSLQYFYILLLYFGLHLVVSYIGYLLGLKDKPI